LGWQPSSQQRSYTLIFSVFLSVISAFRPYGVIVVCLPLVIPLITLLAIVTSWDAMRHDKDKQ
jgi:hypothetical protein